jgi:hypothetical protein
MRALMKLLRFFKVILSYTFVFKLNMNIDTGSLKKMKILVVYQKSKSDWLRYRDDN